MNLGQLIERLKREDHNREITNCAHPMEMEDFERSGYILAMRLLQSDLDLDDLEMGAIAQFTQPEVMRRVLSAMK